ncbi:hypothetical protein EDB84DRAFT_446754 [Lactarius hengduanensis]|nr:hypothetical protein EDB84DRAFT_446754 [Lactarius hengduanensis]
MVNFHDPAVIKADFNALVNMTHCLAGVFLWDFLTTLDFEWDYITGRREFRWTLLLYSLSRLGALGTTICNIVGFNATHQINCQQWVLWSLITAYTSFTCASALISLRVVAIWGRNYLVMALIIGIWLTNVGFLLFGIVMVMVRSPWSPSAGRCLLKNTFRGRDNIALTVATDIAQLIIMLVGLLRSRKTKYGMFRYLYVQGLIWLVAVTIGELPAAIFINLNLNDPWNLMFQNLALFTMEICATRMYRSLANYNMGIDKYSSGPENHGQLRFRTHSRGGTTAISSIVPHISSVRGGLSTDSTEDWGFTLTDETTVEKEETELTEMPSLDPQLTSSRRTIDGGA